MIIYDDQHKFSLLEYGIQIPVMNSRASRTFENLRCHPVLGRRLNDWFRKKENHRLTVADLERVHDRSYVEKLYSDALEGEIIKTFELIDSQGRYYRYDPQSASLPLSRLFDTILERAAGTWQCCSVALENRFCFYCGGGMHHALKNTGNGFCIINDVVIALRKLQTERGVKSAWVIDVDAHKGDGTAALTADDASIITFSAHMANGWPLDGPEHDADGRLNPSFVPSNIDVPIARGEDHLYLPKLEKGLQQLAEFATPDIAVVLLGSDPYEKDALPSTADLRLSLAQLMQRDQMIYNFLKQRAIPQAYLMAGGYGDHSWEVYTQFLQWVLLERLELDRSGAESK